jgi:hypothetical protein
MYADEAALLFLEEVDLVIESLVPPAAGQLSVSSSQYLGGDIILTNLPRLLYIFNAEAIYKVEDAHSACRVVDST